MWCQQEGRLQTVGERLRIVVTSLSGGATGVSRRALAILRSMPSLGKYWQRRQVYSFWFRSAQTLSILAARWEKANSSLIIVITRDALTHFQVPPERGQCLFLEPLF